MGVLGAVVGLSLAAAGPQPASTGATNDAPRFERTGLHLGFSGGVGGCGSVCTFPIAGVGRFEVSHRWGLLSLGAGSTLGGAAYNGAERQGAMTFVSADVFATVNPVHEGRWDPFFGAGFGYHRLADRFSDGRAWVQAPAFRLSVGLPMFVARGVTLGPRFDQVLPVGGTQCSQTNDGTACELWSRQLVGLDREERQRVRRDRERPWAAMLELRVGL